MFHTVKAYAAMHPSIRTSIFPSRYVQGPGAIKLLGTELARLGTQALLILDPFVSNNLDSVIKESVSDKLEATYSVFDGECCDESINKLAQGKQYNVVAGIGGGKTLDTCKAVAYTLKVPMAVIPTIAATDAPCSALSVIYTKTGEFDRYLVLPQNPNLVLVDSEIVCQAPVRFLVSGMGDALATWFEAESCFNSHSGNMTGFMGSYTALGLARMCFDILMEYGVLAKIACEAHATCPALERVIEANTLLSGLGFESSGLAASHAIHNGLCMLPETHKYWHGEKVAFGVATSMFLNNYRAETIERVYSFCEAVGLPTCLQDIGVVDVTNDKLILVAKTATVNSETIHNESGVVTPEAVVAAMKAANNYGIARKAKKIEELEDVY